MKPVVEFLSELRHLQVKLWIDEGRLRYTAPQGTMTPDLLEQMRSRKSEILAFLQQVHPDAPQPIKLISREQDLPLSFAQERLWFLDQLEGKNAAYNMAMAFRLNGHLNLPALEQALKLLISRHEILRTNIATRDGIPVTIVQENSHFSLPLIDLQNLSTDVQEPEVQKLIDKEYLQTFDLEKDSLIRGNLLRLEEQEHILLLTLHHIISDGWSINLLHRELGILYSDEQQGTISSLPKLPIQYIDFAYWQRERFAGRFLQKQLSYWKQQLENAPPLLDLPTDYSRPAIQTFSGAKHIHQLSQPLSEGIKTLSQREGTTLFMTLLAVFNILLSRYTGTEDIVVGSPVAGRTRPELEGLIGFFINTVVLRTHWDNNPSFRELLAKVKDVTLGAYEHQEMPFEKLVEELQPERNLSYNPLFQVWFNMINLEEQKQEMPGLTVEILSTSEANAKFDITLYVSEEAERIDLVWVYNRDLFNPETITTMAERFQTLLENILINPEQPIANLSLLSSKERQRLANGKNTVYPHKPFIEFPKAAIEQSITARFEEQVRKYPDKIAIHTKKHQWTYVNLNDRVNAIAHNLLQLYPEGTSRIALLFDHDAPMIAAILAVLKAGKTYVPLDPSYPQLRLTYILEDCQSTSILTNNKNLAFAQELTSKNIKIINIDEIELDNFADEINLFIAPDTLAYILYTSGSTGQPKGVIQNHRNVLHFIRNYTNNLHIAADDKLTLLASYSFDAAVMDIFGALLNGATLYPIDIKTQTLTHLAKTLKQEKISIYHSTPTVYKHFLETLPQIEESENSFPQIRLVVMGGEEVVKKDVALYKQHFSADCIFVNGLGPTESTVTLQYFINQQTENFDNLIPVGYPIEETEILLVNKLGFNAELYGEIAIRSPYIALGYWQNPQLTQAVFLPDPEATNRRIYRTGDLGRLRNDGTIEFLGRKDFQVKIRGFRIELGEIEATLIQHPLVRKTIVIAVLDTSGDKRLVAYIVSDANSLPTTLELRDFLKDRLPNYMIPPVFVMLDTLPLTPNGKINRLALPAPDFFTVQSNYVAPSNPTEEILTNLWSQVLKIETIGIHDNFFELGGHSLLATLLISRIRQAFNLEIPLRLLFEFPTIAQFCQHIDTADQTESLSLAPIKPRQQSENLPLSFAQQRLWFLDQLEPNSTAYNMSYRLGILGSLNISALEQSLGEILQRHEILHTNFLSLAGQPIQVITNNIDFNLPIIDLQFLPDEQREIEAQRIAKEETQQPFNLAEDSLFRIKLLRLSPEQNLLLINIHHIVFDGWSFRVLFAELKALYTAYSEGLTSPLPQLPIQYADLTLWQREWLAGEVLESQLNYWKRQLSGTLPVLELPTDYPRPPVQTYRGASHSFILSSELTASLKSLCQKEGVTLFMTLLAAFKILLSRYSGQEDVIVGTPIAGRNRREIEDLIGFFVNTLALRTDLSGNPSFRELLNRVRQVTLGAYAHQDLPFEKLVEELQLERNLSHTPIFQVWFNMVNLRSDSLQLNGLKVEPVSVIETTDQETISKFDLNLYIREDNHKINLRLVYNKVLFNPDTIEWMVTHFQRLLAEIVANPQRPISTFSLLNATERYELSHLRNLTCPTNSFNEFPKQEIEQSIPARFEEQVKKYPHKIAIHTKNHQWTYQELNLQANRIAQVILAENLNTEANIALLFDHDAPMIAAILGVLKAGKTYVPLDPKYPQERVLYILEDSLCQVVLTNHNNLVDAQELIAEKLPIINIDELNNNDLALEINHEISPDTIAYLLYTSGSTGKPKGVIQNHRNVLHFIRNYTNNLHISADDKLSLFASYSFDGAIIDIFSTLLNGATLYPFDIKTEGLAHLSAWLEVHKISIYHSTPTVYRSFMQILTEEKQSIAATGLPQIRLVVLGGEEVVKNDVELYQKYFSDECILVNGLGCTESSFNLQYLIDKKTQITHKFVPVGYPFDDTEILLLDDMGNPTDICGEIAIRSPHIALGYWQKPELTKAAFLDDPKGENKRIYRTGDLGRLKSNGVIEFLGRKDFQVKIRGFRIELGEIEATLIQHPTVQKTVVIAREDIPGEKRLVAYIIPRENEASIKEIKQYLKQKLPDYMVPAAFVVLDVLPLTPNGKINRLALPAPDFTKLESAEYTTPSDNLELQLTKIWENVLGIRPIGLNDNFFDVGGHSLLAVRLFAQIEKIFGKNIALTILFQAPTIRQLANVLRDEGYSSSWSSLVPIQPHGSKRPFFYVHTIYGGFIYSLNLLSKLDADQPVYGLQAQGLDGKKSPHTCVEDMASHYIKEIQTVQPHGPYLLGGWCAGGVIAYEMAQQLYAQGETVELLTIFDAFPPKMIPSSPQVVNSLFPVKRKSRISKFTLLYLIDMIQRNRRNFNNLTLQQQMIAIWEKINRRIQDRITETVYQFYVKRNLPLPHTLRHLAVRDAIVHAYRNYCPTVYAGKVTFFRAVDQSQEYADYLQRWEEIAAGGLEIHDIPGNHDSIMAEPHVSVLAQKLRDCLNR
ncbi:non-ribosomal peptide synthetase [Trichormus sp. NMC-1]|uniref:non-ribosomal peptide synthetase n=1 Tax=Trichormus sp. NMC-1 TaxID=1853259 RepID=UPI0008DBEA08|nr:non-ribosomal peptide synthetase [Trichormus sp. NMC-1]